MAAKKKAKKKAKAKRKPTSSVGITNKNQRKQLESLGYVKKAKR